MTSFPASRVILDGIFLLCLTTLGTGALIAIFSSRLIRSVCGLAIACVGLAGLYYFLHSPFLALMEILIYVGAVCVTIVFAVMLAEPEEPSPNEKRGASVVWGAMALLVTVALFAVLSWLGIHGNWSINLSDASIEAIGRALLTTYSLAFELISVALLVAILGALAIARTGRTRFEVSASAGPRFGVPASAGPIPELDRAAAKQQNLLTPEPVPAKAGTPYLV
jgi:NADH:ubiquinone oxidoreductase subunit 6 (subunit J)